MDEEGEGDISGRLRILKDFFDEFNFHPNKPPCFDDVRRPGGRRVTVPNALQKLHKLGEILLKNHMLTVPTLGADPYYEIVQTTKFWRSYLDGGRFIVEVRLCSVGPGNQSPYQIKPTQGIALDIQGVFDIENSIKQ